MASHAVRVGGATAGISFRDYAGNCKVVKQDFVNLDGH
jgi:hypothetical protein